MRRGITLLAVVLLAACSGGGEDTLPTADAAGAVRAAVEQGDDLFECPFGDTGALFAAVPDDVPLNDAIRAGDVEDHGQVFRGGDVDITYCDVVPDPFAEDGIAEVRLDASAGDVDLDTYLVEEWVFDAGDVDLTDGDDLAGGSVRTGCWDDDCGFFWQGDGLFVAVVAADDADVIGRAILPAAVRNLAAFES